MFIPRISVAVLTICVLIVFSVLTFTTPPATLPSKQNGQTVFVVAYVQNSITGQSAYSLASFGTRNSIYVLPAAHSPPIQSAYGCIHPIPTENRLDRSCYRVQQEYQSSFAAFIPPEPDQNKRSEIHDARRAGFR